MTGVPTDNKSGGSSTYNADVAPVSPSGTGCEAIYSTPNASSTVTSITINISGAATYSMGFIEEWSGVATASH